MIIAFLNGLSYSCLKSALPTKNVRKVMFMPIKNLINVFFKVNPACLYTDR